MNPISPEAKALKSRQRNPQERRDRGLEERFLVLILPRVLRPIVKQDASDKVIASSLSVVH